MQYSTEQEQFWQGDFGNEYIQRNRGSEAVAANIALFSKILSRTNKISSILELGSNIGVNLRALHHLLPQTRLSAVEINANAVQILQQEQKNVEVFESSILDFTSEKMWDLVFTKGVLIHIAPDKLPLVYNKLYHLSSQYILVCEYYNPQPVEVLYRGNTGKLFKRDFAGELLDQFKDLRIVDYGFVYHRDLHFRQDDLNWFLLEKQPPKI